MTKRSPGTCSTTSYVYANVRPRKRASKATRVPTASGGGVRHSTRRMLAYQRGALSGSTANAATSATGAAMARSVLTSTGNVRLAVRSADVERLVDVDRPTAVEDRA